jgi:MFS family permease
MGRRTLRDRLPPALRHRDFALLCVAIACSVLPAQMVAVAIGWQVYAIHENPLHLGLIGLVEFLPLPLLALPAGQLADRVSRRLVFAAALVLETAVAALLLVVSLGGARELWTFLALAGALGVAAAVGTPAARSLPPMLVPPDVLPNAIALRSIVMQGAIIVGPAIGGVLFAVRPELVYGIAAGLLATSAAGIVTLRERGPAAPAAAVGLESLLAGIRFVRRTPMLFGAILLDLFAVLFGGAVALLPVFAKDVLDVGPEGLGVLRAAPGAGALLAAVVIAHRPIGGWAGRKLLVVVAVFGACTVVFGLSRSFGLSLAALGVAGAADMFSVNIRAMIVALATPDELRGRVNAVEMVFISASNELGAFESGVAAALLGAVPAVVAGGAATILIALVWLRFFPALARIDRLESLRPG